MDGTTLLIIILAAAVAFYVLKVRSSGMKPDEFRQKLDRQPGIIIDVRTPAEYKSGHLKQADYNIDVMSASFSKRLKKLDKNKTYYLYCRTGSRSGRAAKIMQKNGFEEVYNVGGFQRLVNSGFPEA